VPSGSGEEGEQTNSLERLSWELAMHEPCVRNGARATNAFLSDIANHLLCSNGLMMRVREVLSGELISLLWVLGDSVFQTFAQSIRIHAELYKLWGPRPPRTLRVPLQ
jgi:hypothetical protein